MKNAPGGPTKLTFYTVDRGPSGMFMVGVTDYTPGALQSELPSRALDGTRDGALANVKGQLRSEEEVSLKAGGASYPGRAIVADAPHNLVMRLRVYLVKDRLYQIMTVNTMDQDGPEDLARMAQSFHLVAVPTASKP